MISYKTSKKVDFTSKEIFDLVMDIEKYPDFLEWVSGARIIEKQDNLVVAKLDIYFKGYKTSYISNITTKFCKLNTQIDFKKCDYGSHLQLH